MRGLIVPAALALSACAAEKAPEPKPTPVPVRAEPRTLIPADLDPEGNGWRVKGTEITDALIGSEKAPFARYDAFVHCADEAVPVCDPNLLPPDTIYTYILTITPLAVAPTAAPAANETLEASPAPDDLVQPVAPPELVRTIRPVPRFKGEVGFAMGQAAEALGGDDALSVTLEENRLVWRVTRGSWKRGTPITLWWRSARPPAKAAPAYRLELGGKSVEIRAPFPTADKPVERDPAR